MRVKGDAITKLVTQEATVEPKPLEAGAPQWTGNLKEYHAAVADGGGRMHVAFAGPICAMRDQRLSQLDERAMVGHSGQLRAGFGDCLYARHRIKQIRKVGLGVHDAGRLVYFMEGARERGAGVTCSIGVDESLDVLRADPFDRRRSGTSRPASPSHHKKIPLR